MQTFRLFQEDDVLDIIPKADILCDNSKTELLSLACSSISYTLLVNGKVIAIMGGSKLWAGCFQMWAIMTPGIHKNGLFLTKTCNLILLTQAKKLNIHRYHCLVDANSIENVRWLYLIGFKYESTMYKASPSKTDIHMYVRQEN